MMTRQKFLKRLAGLLILEFATGATAEGKPARPTKAAATQGPSSKPSQSAGQGGKAVTEPVSVESTITVNASGEMLDVAYTVHNRSAQRIWVLDQMLEITAGGLAAAPHAIIVENGEEPGRVKLIRGYVPADHPVLMQVVPAARVLGPGERLLGTAQTAWPLTAWHPNGRPLPLKDKPTTVVIAVGYLTGEPRWASMELVDHSKPHIPALSSVGTQQQAFSAPLGLPIR
ncbi:MAG TPA: hypothetical protein PKV55_06345 [Nitrospira sp.]|nr:hypothetical protein [Nitrospira sp.]